MDMDEPAGPWIRAGPALGAHPAGAEWIISGQEWCEARSYLAAEVLDLVREFGPLDEIQRTVLVPLELELASCTDVAWWGPRQWVTGVEGALSRRRRRCRRAVPREGAHLDDVRRPGRDMPHSG